MVMFAVLIITFFAVIHQQAYEVGFDLGESRQGGQGQEEILSFKRHKQTSNDKSN